jgi:outer membrane protein assembly factor BamB
MRYLNVILILLGISIFSKGQNPGLDWPVFRGNYNLSGSTSFEVPSSPVLKWSLPTGVNTKSSPVLSDGQIYFGNDKGTLYAVGTDGKIRWKFETGSTIEAPPLVYENKVIIGSFDGVLRAVDKSSGKLLW